MLGYIRNTYRIIYPKTIDKAGKDGFTSFITGLTGGKQYYVRAYATNSKGTGYGNTIIFSTEPYGTMTDIDGNIYKTVIIGNQCWMAENLKVSSFRNGDSIFIKDNTISSSISWPSYSNYLGKEEYINDYGFLYNWYAVIDNRQLAPISWHVPTDEEWKELEIYLGMNYIDTEQTGFRGSNEGGKLKETGFAHWQVPNTGATNESAFSARPGYGSTYENSDWNTIREWGYFWTSTESEMDRAWCRFLRNICSLRTVPEVGLEA